MVAEDAEGLEMLDRAASRARQVRRGIGVSGRQVKGQCRAGGGRRPAGRHDELVGHQVVTDESHPSGNSRMAGGQVEHVALSIEHGSDVAGERQSIGV